MIDVHMIISAIAGVLMFLLAIIGWFLREKVKDNDTRINEHEARIHQLEISRAESAVEVRQILQNLGQIGDLRTEIAMRFITREDMAMFLGKIEVLQGELGALREQLAHHRGRSHADALGGAA